MISLSARTLASITLVCLGVTPLLARTLSFEERVRAQESIERVYYSHQIGATRPFEDAMPRSRIEEKVRNSLKESVALEKLWKTPLTAEALHREIERIARNTRFPERILEVYRVLGEDPLLIEECFVRPILAERLSRNFFALDPRFQASSRALASNLLQRIQTGRPDTESDRSHRWLTEISKQVSKPSVAAAVGQKSEDDLAPGPERFVISPEEFSRERRRLPWKIGETGPLLEGREEWTFKVLLDEDPDRLVVATYSIPKETWDSWWRAASGFFEESRVSAVAGEEPLPLPASRDDALQTGGGAGSQPGLEDVVPDDTWQNGILDAMPDGRHDHSAVWTGNRMILWGGDDGNYRYFQTGALYDPLTDTWTSISRSGAPCPRSRHSAAWTGSQMIIWGGFNGDGNPLLNSGGRYDPATDSWAPMSQAGAPVPRKYFSSLWTGSLFIVWGGEMNPTLGTTYFQSGARYDPAADAWSPTSLLNAPAPRASHSAIWTGSLMVVWGGHNPDSLSTGGRYDPVTDTWAPTAVGGAPSARESHSAVWTGNRMIVWGGGWPLTSSGGRYDPVTDTWQPTSLLNAPVPRQFPTSLWTGSQLIVWGGYGSSGLNTGGRYDPVADTWTPTDSTSAPPARYFHTAIWTGNQMIVWGGFVSSPPKEFTSGGRYNPTTDSWTPTSTGSGPSARSYASAVWTGSHMIVWGGYGTLNTGGKYDPLTDDWTPTATLNAPSARYFHTAVWTGNLMIIWGGGSSTNLNDGGRYDPVSDTWAPTSTAGAPDPRMGHTAVWTGGSMVVWGGNNGPYGVFNTGGRYDPVADTWAPTNPTGAPSARYFHTAVWTGGSMMIWGGDDLAGQLSTGGRYDPATDIWMPVSTLNAPSARRSHSAIWTGHQMIVWGGHPVSDPSVGGRYDPDSDSWAFTSTEGAPSGREHHTATWTGAQMIVWGGFGSGVLDTGGRYDPSSDSWTTSSTSNSPVARSGHIAVWTGESMIVWGGFKSSVLASGGRYFVVEGDADLDSVPPGVDNCPTVFNTGQEDTDLDGRGDVCDCAPNDSSAFTAPGEIANLWWDSESMMRWNPLQLNCGLGITYDVIKGDLVPGMPSSAPEVCQLSESSQTFLEDAMVPTGPGQFYLARGRNACGIGSYGANSAGQERQRTACP